MNWQQRLDERNWAMRLRFESGLAEDDDSAETAEEDAAEEKEEDPTWT